MLEIVPIKAEHVKALGLPVTRSVKGVAVIEGDEVLGIAAYYPLEASMLMGADFSPKAREYLTQKKHLRILIKAGRMVRDMAAAAGTPVDSWAVPEIDGSGRLLEHLGFKPLEREVYRWAQ